MENWGFFNVQLEHYHGAMGRSLSPPIYPQGSTRMEVMEFRRANFAGRPEFWEHVKWRLTIGPATTLHRGGLLGLLCRHMAFLFLLCLHDLRRKIPNTKHFKTHMHLQSACLPDNEPISRPVLTQISLTRNCWEMGPRLLSRKAAGATSPNVSAP
jgi:hypothetical protein